MVSVNLEVIGMILVIKVELGRKGSWRLGVFRGRGLDESGGFLGFRGFFYF